jgi:uncharacterized protein YdhG (YjbR/CyaY superfamily)
MESIESYLAKMTEEQLIEYQRLKLIVKNELPNSTESISYGMPTLKHDGTVVLHFGVFKDHVSIFPGPKAITKLAPELANYKISKGTIQYQTDAPIPKNLINKIIAINIR